MNFLISGAETFERGYKLEDLISERTKKVLSKKVLFNPLDEFAGIVPKDYVVFSVLDVIKFIKDAVLKENLLIERHEIWVERTSLNLIYLKVFLNTRDNIVKDNDIGLELEVEINVLVGSVKIDSVTMIMDASIELSTFSKAESAKKGVESAVDKTKIEDAVKKLVAEWKGKSSVKYRRLNDKEMTNREVYAHVQAMKIPAKEKDKIMKRLKEEFGLEFKTSMWKFYVFVIRTLSQGLVFPKTRDLRRNMQKMVEEKYVTCYNGTPHEFIGG